MKDIAIYGAGGFGREVLTLVEEVNRDRKEYNFIGFFDDGKEKGEIVNNYPVIGNIDVLNSWGNPLSLIIALGNPGIKRTVFEKIHNSNLSFPSLIHPSVLIGDSQRVKIEEGCIVCAGNILTVNIVVHKFVILNLGCTVGHDTNIGEFSSFMPSVNISGDVIIGREVYVGTGAKIINQLSVGMGTVIGAGAVVTKSLPEKCTAVGIPAKVIK